MVPLDGEQEDCIGQHEHLVRDHEWRDDAAGDDTALHEQPDVQLANGRCQQEVPRQLDGAGVQDDTQEEHS